MPVAGVGAHCRDHLRREETETRSEAIVGLNLSGRDRTPGVFERLARARDRGEPHHSGGALEGVTLADHRAVGLLIERPGGERVGSLHQATGALLHLTRKELLEIVVGGQDSPRETM